METNFSINVIFDSEADVFVGRSENIPGLIIEENSIPEFIETAMELVPYLLEKNLNITDNDGEVVNVHIDLQTTPETKTKSRRVNPVYSLHAEPDRAYATA